MTAPQIPVPHCHISSLAKPCNQLAALLSTTCVKARLGAAPIARLSLLTALQMLPAQNMICLHFPGFADWVAFGKCHHGARLPFSRALRFASIDYSHFFALDIFISDISSLRVNFRQKKSLVSVGM